MSTAAFPGNLSEFRARWLNTNSASYDSMTAQMRNYLAMLDRPLLSICRGRVLEIATGTGRFLTEICKQPGVEMAVGIDFAAQMLRTAAEKGCSRLIQGNAESLPFATSSFDSVVCTFFSFRDIDRVPAFAEAARVLKQGGYLGFTLRNYYISYLEALWQHFLSRRRLPRSLSTLDGADGVMFDMREIDDEVLKLERAGFRVREVKTVRFLPFIRRFIEPGYWSGLLGTKLGSDVIIIAEKI